MPTLKLPKFTPLQLAVHLGAWFPLARLGYDYASRRLSVNPIQDLTFGTGKPALVLLVLSLACTPVNTLFSWRQALKVRRALGLYAFGYGLLHFLIFTGLDYGFDLGLLRAAIFQKRYALVGLAAFIILLPLALTSTDGWKKRLGKRWKSLHRGAYAAGLLAAIHYIWLVKSDIREPLIYTALIAFLLVMRLPAVRRAVVRWRGANKPQME